MSKQLYEEALADIKKLKEVAEDNAKRELLEAVTPRIRDLIENQLLGELGEVDNEKILLDDEMQNYNNEFSGEMSSNPEETPMSLDNFSDNNSCNDDDEMSTSDLDAVTNFNLGMLSSEVPNEEYELSVESAKKLGILMNSKDNVVIFENKLKEIGRQISLFKKASNLIKESKGYYSTISALISEVENTYSYLQKEMQKNSKKDSYESILENYYSTLKQLTEQKTMKKTNRSRRLSEGDVTLKLTGMPDELDLDSIGVDLITGEEDSEGGDDMGGDEGGDDLDLGGDDEGGDDMDGDEGDEGGDDLDLGGDDEGGDDSENKMESRRLSDNTIIEIDEGMLRREISRMKKLREEATPSTDGNGPGDVSDDFEDDNYGDPFTDIKLTTETQEDEEEFEEAQVEDDLEDSDEDLKNEGELEEPKVDQGYGMGQGSKRHGDLDGHDEDTLQPNVQSDVVESLKRKLRHEVRIQAEARKKAGQAKRLHKEAVDSRSRVKAAKLKNAYNFFARKFNESVKRTSKLKGMLSEAARKGRTLNGSSARSTAETKNLRNKLAETNLFNAKLLFTNKLLQNESLTKRQKAEVIERLDEAKNEREVKLVYESLVKALQGSAPQKLSESAERSVMGSGSRPARSAAATNLNEGYEADRWARLAGIVK